MKNSKTQLIISIVLISLALILFAGASLWGVIFLAIGIFFLLRFLKMKKAAQPAPELPKATVMPEEEEEAETGENIRPAGTSYYQEELQSLGALNPDYKLTKKQIIDAGLENQPIYEYEFDPLPAEFVFEPDNEHDPNAIAIYVKGKKIGYVKKGSTSHIRKLIQSGRLQDATCQIRGGNVKTYWDGEEELRKETGNFYARIHLDLKDND